MGWRKPKSIGDAVAILKRHKKKAFFPAVAGMVGLIVASLFIPRQYNAEAKFERRLGLTATQTQRSDIAVRRVEADRRLLAEDLKGRSALEQLVEDLELTRGMPRVQGELTPQGQMMKMDLIRKLSSRIYVRVQVKDDDNELIAVSFDSDDRDLAPKLVNRLMNNYIRKSQLELEETLKGAKSFFDKEVLRYSTAMRELEGKKLRFEMDHRGLLPDDPQSVQDRLAELRSQLNVVTKDARLSVADRDAMKTWLTDQPVFIAQEQMGPNPLLEELTKRLRDLEAEYENNRLGGRTDQHPAMVKLKQRLSDLKVEISLQPKAVKLSESLVPNTQRQQAERDLAALTRKIEELERQREELQGQVDHYDVLSRNFFVVRNDYLRLMREVKDAEQQLEFWQERAKRTQIAVQTQMQAQGVRMKVRQEAPELLRPSKPTAIQIAVMAFFTGAGLAAGMVLLAELLDRSFRSVEHAVDELKLPVLGAINEIITPGRALRRKVLGWGVYPALGLAMVMILISAFAVAYLSLEYPNHFEKLRHRPGDFIKDALAGRLSS